MVIVQKMAPQPKAVVLTIMSDADGSARSRNCEYAGRFIIWLAAQLRLYLT